MFDRCFRVLEQILGRSGLFLPVLVISLNLGLSLLTEIACFHHFPYSTDEYSCLISAQLMAEGRLSAPSPEPREFFGFENIVNNGRYYGKYPPGWPALLSIGVRCGVPWLIAPLLGAATLAILYAAARRHFSLEAANAAMISILFSPFFLFNTASYFSHAACLFGITLFVTFYLEVLKEPARLAAYAGLGVGAGIAFSVRPFTTLALGVVPSVHLIWNAVRSRKLLPLLRGAPLALAGLSLCLIPFFAYNRAQTGHAFLQPFQVYNPADHLAFPASLREIRDRVMTHVLKRSVHFSIWCLQGPILVLLIWKTKFFKDDPRLRWLALAWIALEVAYVGYPAYGGFQYGPRYLYEGLTALVLVSAAALVRIGRVGIAALAGLVLFNVAGYAMRAPRYAAEIGQGRRMYELAQAPELRNSIVFLNEVSRTMDASDCTRNGVTFDGPVLFVHDLGSRNPELLRRHPGRRAFVYVFEPRTDDGRFVPWKARED